MKIRVIRALLPGALIVSSAGQATAQSYPNKPIRVVAAEAGGGGDFSMRVIAPSLAEYLGQPVVIDNRGGSVLIQSGIVAKAAPDGYTLLFVGSAHWMLPLMRDRPPYDPIRDFAPITLAVNSPSILSVPPSLPAKSVKELIALAKARPGQLNYASGPTGTSNHPAAELLNSMAAIQITRIAYKGTAAGINDVIAGQVQLMFANAAAIMPHARSGRVRAMAVTSAQPSALYPELPTMAASGLPDYESGSALGMFAPLGTPKVLVDRINRDVVRAFNRPDVKERLFNAAVKVVATTPEGFTAYLKSEAARWGKVIKAAGIRDE